MFSLSNVFQKPSPGLDWSLAIPILAPRPYFCHPCCILYLLKHICDIYTLWLEFNVGFMTLLLPVGRTVVTDLWAGADDTASRHSWPRLRGLPEAPAAARRRCWPSTWRHHCAARGLWKLPTRVCQTLADARCQCQCCLRGRPSAFACLYKPWIPWVSEIQ